jgi:hypothetical protein
MSEHEIEIEKGGVPESAPPAPERTSALKAAAASHVPEKVPPVDIDVATKEELEIEKIRDEIRVLRHGHGGDVKLVEHWMPILASLAAAFFSFANLYVSLKQVETAEQSAEASSGLAALEFATDADSAGRRVGGIWQLQSFVSSQLTANMEDVPRDTTAKVVLLVQLAAHDPDAIVRFQAAEAIGALYTAESIPRLGPKTTEALRAILYGDTRSDDQGFITRAFWQVSFEEQERCPSRPADSSDPAAELVVAPECAQIRSRHSSLAEATGQNREDLRFANLTGTNLSYTDLSEAHLEGARLAYANLQCADLSGAHLDGAELGNVRWENANITGAQMDSAARRVAVAQGALDQQTSADDESTSLPWWQSVEACRPTFPN